MNVFARADHPFIRRVVVIHEETLEVSGGWRLEKQSGLELSCERENCLYILGGANHTDPADSAEST